jgi:hypothetical protein
MNNLKFEIHITILVNVKSFTMLIKSIITFLEYLMKHSSETSDASHHARHVISCTIHDAPAYIRDTGVCNVLRNIPGNMA